jgi:hypothetical protein
MIKFLQQIASIIVASTIVWGTVITAYTFLDDDIKIATMGWVKNSFGGKQDFLLMNQVKRNINYYERKKCQGTVLSDDDHTTLEQSYEFYEIDTGFKHRYETMARVDVCIDRLGT